jgi:hypothetical protein
MLASPTPFSSLLVPERGHDNCSETSSVFIIRPTAQWYGVLVTISWVFVTFSGIRRVANRVIILWLIVTFDTAGEVPMIRINNHRLNEKVRKISPLRLMKAPAEAGFSRIFDFASSITFGEAMRLW